MKHNFDGFKCPSCGYDLTRLKRPVCPECGRDLDPHDVFQQRTYGMLIVPRWLALGLLAVIFGILTAMIGGMLGRVISFIAMGFLVSALFAYFGVDDG